MLDLTLFRDRLFAAASAAAFINGLSRFALMFLFVFYFQGPQGKSPIVAGLELAPLAIGMLVSSPLAGMVADRHGSRGLAALGMVVSAAGLAGMTMLQAHTAYVWSALWLALVGIGSGMFNSPNTAAMMGVVPVHRRGIAAGARVMLQNTGAVISIAFVMAVVTSAVPTKVLFAIFSGITSGLSTKQLDPFIANMHMALWVLTGVSLLGAAVSMLRPAHVAQRLARRDLRGGGMIRIGEVAERTGLTPRTIRYYEEIGLLPVPAERRKGAHRAYGDDDVERLNELTRLRDLLNLSLDELKQLVEAEEARAAIRKQFHATESDAERLRLLDAALPHVETQLELVRARLGELQRLESELVAKRKSILARKRELSS